MRLILFFCSLLLASCGSEDPTGPAVCQRVDEIRQHFDENRLTALPDHRIELRGFVFTDREFRSFDIDAEACDVIVIDFIYPMDNVRSSHAYYDEFIDRSLRLSKSDDHILRRVPGALRFEYGEFEGVDGLTRIAVYRHAYVVVRDVPSHISYNMQPQSIVAIPGWRSVRVDINSADVDNSPNPN